MSILVWHEAGASVFWFSGLNRQHSTSPCNTSWPTKWTKWVKQMTFDLIMNNIWWIFYASLNRVNVHERVTNMHYAYFVLSVYLTSFVFVCLFVCFSRLCLCYIFLMNRKGNRKRLMRCDPYLYVILYSQYWGLLPCSSSPAIVILNLNLVKMGLSMAAFLVTQPFWDFAQNTTVSFGDMSYVATEHSPGLLAVALHHQNGSLDCLRYRWYIVFSNGIFS